MFKIKLSIITFLKHYNIYNILSYLIFTLTADTLRVYRHSTLDCAVENTMYIFCQICVKDHLRRKTTMYINATFRSRLPLIK